MRRHTVWQWSLDNTNEIRRAASPGGSFGIWIPFLQREIPSAYFFHVRDRLTLVSNTPSVCQDVRHSPPGRLAIGRFRCRKRQRRPQASWELDTADLILVGSSVDFFPPALCKLLAAECFPTPEARLSSQQSRTYLMNDGRGLRWKWILIALIARIQAFKNDLDGWLNPFLSVLPVNERTTKKLFILWHKSEDK